MKKWEPKPLWLRYALHECNISQKTLGELLGYSAHFGNVLRGEFSSYGDIRVKILAFLAGSSLEARKLRDWMHRREMGPMTLLEPGPKSLPPKGFRKSGKKIPLSVASGDALRTEAQMLKLKTMKYFNIKKSPFANEINSKADIFFSEDHIFIKEMMRESSRYSGFTAIFGEVGSGKSTMRKALVRELQDEGVHIVFPQILDKRKISATSLLDAIIMDVSDETPKSSMEAKSRQAIRLLKSRRANNLQQVLLVEEAHLLNNWALKHLKQLWEFEDGYRKLIGIVLIGQPELAARLDETQSPQLREVIRRVTVAEIEGLSERDLPRYLSHKFGRVNAKIDRVFTPEAFPAMSRRLLTENGTGITHNVAYPLNINNLAIRAMNHAAKYGEERVTDEVVLAL